ncbi:hypothetical protein J8J22_20835, partial [Mycobacterium tuberculosis]|nr:hypothetical protein [Mycobacterium tuberculosis]
SMFWLGKNRACHRTSHGQQGQNLETFLQHCLNLMVPLAGFSFDSPTRLPSHDDSAAKGVIIFLK